MKGKHFIFLVLGILTIFLAYFVAGRSARRTDVGPGLDRRVNVEVEVNGEGSLAFAVGAGSDREDAVVEAERVEATLGPAESIQQEPVTDVPNLELRLVARNGGEPIDWTLLLDVRPELRDVEVTFEWDSQPPRTLYWELGRLDTVVVRGVTGPSMPAGGHLKFNDGTIGHMVSAPNQLAGHYDVDVSSLLEGARVVAEFCAYEVGGRQVPLGELIVSQRGETFSVLDRGAQELCKSVSLGYGISSVFARSGPLFYWGEVSATVSPASYIIDFDHQRKLTVNIPVQHNWMGVFAIPRGLPGQALMLPLKDEPKGAWSIDLPDGDFCITAFGSMSELDGENVPRGILVYKTVIIAGADKTLEFSAPLPATGDLDFHVRGTAGVLTIDSADPPIRVFSQAVRPRGKSPAIALPIGIYRVTFTSSPGAESNNGDFSQTVEVVANHTTKVGSREKEPDQSAD